MFENKNFFIYKWEQIPLNCDCFLIDEIYLHEFEKACLGYFDGHEYSPVGYISYIGIREINANSLEISWFPNMFERYHEVSVTLPKEDMVICVECNKYDDKPRLFVKSEWLENLHIRHYSIFALIDAIDVIKAIRKGALTKEKILSLRTAIDELASKYPSVTFISFADSILLKSNWTAGYFKNGIKYTYRPEMFIYIFRELQAIYKRILCLEIYGVFTQGTNEYYDDALLHSSELGNHLCLNSLGIPFSDLQSIENKVKSCIREEVHPGSDLYLDKEFFNSLRFKLQFDKKSIGNHEFASKMKANSSYYYCQCKTIIDNLAL
ncbi:hypothetical protein MTYP_03176 [Methylophilaceae bacterium]|nr:hypothetical protein MTYP_03176 [Methylophilaceae bacterium]